MFLTRASVVRRALRAAACALVVLLPQAVAAQSVVGVLGITSEIAPMEKRLEGSREVTVRGVAFRVGTLQGRRVVVGRSGTGKVNAAIATTVLIGEFQPSAIVFTGTAGGVDPELEPGDVVIGATLAHHDIGQMGDDGLQRRGPRHAVTGVLDPVLLPAPDRLLAAARRAINEVSLPPMPGAQAKRIPRIVEGVIVTGEMFVANTRQREELRRSFTAAAVEMEGAAVVQTCRHFDVPCLVVRSITDRADGQARASYQSLRGAASENAATVAAAIIGKLDPSPR